MSVMPLAIPCNCRQSLSRDRRLGPHNQPLCSVIKLQPTSGRTRRAFLGLARRKPQMHEVHQQHESKCECNADEGLMCDICNASLSRRTSSHHTNQHLQRHCHNNTGQLHEQKFPPRHMHQTAHRDHWRSRARNETRSEQHK